MLCQLEILSMKKYLSDLEPMTDQKQNFLPLNKKKATVPTVSEELKNMLPFLNTLKPEVRNNLFQQQDEYSTHFIVLVRLFLDHQFLE